LCAIKIEFNYLQVKKIVGGYIVILNIMLTIAFDALLYGKNGCIYMIYSALARTNKFVGDTFDKY
jgi:hypothetical protein